MTQRDDPKLRLSQPPSERHIGDWLEDWQEITGEPYSFESWAHRCHPNDLTRVASEWFRSARDRVRFRCSYRIVDGSGAWTRICADLIPFIGDEWVGTIRRCAPAEDKKVMAEPFITFSCEWPRK